MIIPILAVIGIILSIYAYSIERKSKNKNYKALCDFNENVSCTIAFSSRYGKTLGISNSIYGTVFYLIILILSFYNLAIVFYLAILSVIGSIYLAYISFVKLKNACLICIGVYVVNILLLISSWRIL